MPGTGIRKGRLISSVVTLLTVVGALVTVGCGDRRANEGSPTRPSFQGGGGGEGGVTGAVDREVVVHVGGGTYPFDFADTTVYAPFQDGWAHVTAEVGVPSALGVLPDAFPGTATGADTLVDESGNVHVIAFTGSSSPPSHVQHFVNGELRSDRFSLWVWTEAGWVLSETYVELYADGGDKITLWTSHNGQIASAGLPAVQYLKDIASAPLALFRPTPLAAQHYWACRREWGTYLIASLALDATMEAALLAPSLITVEFFLAAAGAWGAALDNLTDCFGEHDS